MVSEYPLIIIIIMFRLYADQSNIANTSRSDIDDGHYHRNRFKVTTSGGNRYLSAWFDGTLDHDEVASAHSPAGRAITLSLELRLVVHLEESMLFGLAGERLPIMSPHLLGEKSPKELKGLFLQQHP